MTLRLRYGTYPDVMAQFSDGTSWETLSLKCPIRPTGANDDTLPLYNDSILRKQLWDRHYTLMQSLPTPSLGWPLVDTLKGTRYPRVKELRVILSNEEWRIAFVFDPELNAVLLVAGKKTGINQRLFYSRLITIEEKRYHEHLEHLS